MSAVVYRMYDADDSLLYVGQTTRGLDRLSEHESKKWWADVDLVTVEHCPTVEDALRIEREVILNEQPRFNGTMHGRPRSPRTRQFRGEQSAAASKRDSDGQRLWRVFHGDATPLALWARTREAAEAKYRRQILNRYCCESEILAMPVVIFDDVAVEPCDEAQPFELTVARSTRSVS